MEEDCEFRPWDDLIPEALELIFRNLSLKDKLIVIPSVCKSWRRAVNGPDCWLEIEIEGWNHQNSSETLNRLLQMLLTRSSGKLNKLCISRLANDQSLSLIADHAQSLHTLKVPHSQISDEVVERVAARLPNLTYLDLSYCEFIGAPALEAIGRYCKHLTRLDRSIYGWIQDRHVDSVDKEAFAIAATMPKLKHLNIFNLPISTEGVLKILSGCSQLEFLDIRGCRGAKIDDDKFFEKFPRVKVLYSAANWSDFPPLSFDSAFFDEMFADFDFLEAFGDD